MHRDQIIQTSRDELDAIRADWTAAKLENPHLVESVGKPMRNWTCASTPPLIRDKICSHNWMVSTGRLKRWEDAQHTLKVGEKPFPPTSEQSKKGVRP
jgi:hypothetical protein